MADPLTALGLASNVAHFISYTSELIEKDGDIHKAKAGPLIKRPDLDTITRSLVESNDGVKFTVTLYRETDEVEESRRRRVKERLMHGKPEEKPVETLEERIKREHEEILIPLEEHLSNLCSDCNDIAQELLGALSDLKSKGSDGTWNTFREALSTVWKEEYIEAVCKRLEEHQMQLGEHILGLLSEHVHFNQTTYQDLLTDSLAHMEKDNKRYQERIEELSQKQVDQPQDQQRLDAVKKQRDEALQKQHYQTEILQFLQKSQGKPGVKSFSSQLSDTARKQREEIIQRQLLEKLRFDDMRNRYRDISKAHKDTFRWVFLGSDHVKDVERHGQPVRTGSPEDMHREPDAPSPISPIDDNSSLPPNRGWWNTLLRRRTTNVNDRSVKWDNYRTWLQGNENLYWIKGRPGAGKSTLMKLLHDDQYLKSYLQAWRGDSDLVIAGFFFWNSGEVMQMSKQGLLRALLYQAVESRPHLLPKLFPDRWTYNTLFGPDIRDWEVAELEQAFKTLATDNTRKYFIMIDGLDEFRGPPEELAKFLLECCASGPHVKMCVSSRPMHEFESAFQSRPTLSLEQLTETDIEIYVKDELVKNEVFLKLQEKDPVKCKALIHDITLKARGVFLWAQLVMGALLEGLGEEDTVEYLQNRLRAFPSDLNNLLEKIWSQVQENDFEHSSRIFRLFQKADRPMSLLSLHYAEEGYESAVADDFKSATPQQLDLLAGQMRQQLNSQCATMLDAPSFKEDGAWAKVQYLHRSVKDFLEKQETRDSLKSASPDSDYELALALCAGYLRCLKKMDPALDPPFERFEQLASDCLEFSKAVEVGDQTKNLQILKQLDGACLNLVGTKNPSKEKWRKNIQSCVPLVSAPHWTNACPSRTGSSNFFDFCFRSGFYSYVEHALGEQLCTPNPELPHAPNLLAAAIEDDRIDFRLVALLLTHGASPNQPGAFAEFKTPWYLLLAAMAAGIEEPTNLSAGQRERLGKMAQLFLEHGAHPFTAVRGRPAEEILRKVVGMANQGLAERLVKRLEEAKRKNPQLKPKLSKLKRLKNFLRS